MLIGALSLTYLAEAAVRRVILEWRGPSLSGALLIGLSLLGLLSMMMVLFLSQPRRRNRSSTASPISENICAESELAPLTESELLLAETLPGPGFWRPDAVAARLDEAIAKHKANPRARANGPKRDRAAYMRAYRKNKEAEK